MILEIGAAILTVSLWWGNRKINKMHERINVERNKEISKRALLSFLRELDLDPHMRRVQWLFGIRKRRPRLPPKR